jgi:hypothetical protein
MKIALSIQETLIWHDFPQLFVAKDKIGGLHLCLAVDELGDTPQYISVALSTARLQDVKLGKTDLYTVFAYPELSSWFYITLLEKGDVLAEAAPFSEKIPEKWLPMPNEFLPRATLLRSETFEVVKIGAVAKEAGMNPTLLRQYLSGIKRPSAEQALKVQNALHRVAQRLLEVHFV